ncbi:MAG: ABC transporter permease [Bacteroides sp.]|nr:ABC transporter permease [Bacteroides sp.]
MSFSALPLRIAWRYLRAPKSHSAVSAISIISVVGVAVATAAIVCVLSVFNGFRGLLNNSLDTLAPDVIVTPSTGKTFSNADSILNIIKNVNGVSVAMPAVCDNALAISSSREMPIYIRGVVTDIYPQVASIDSIMLEKVSIASYSPSDAAISVGVARQLAIYEPDNTPLFIFAPKREGRVNLANPMMSFVTDSLNVRGIFQAMQSEYDENTVICDITVARELFQYENEVTAVEIKTAPGVPPQQLADALRTTLGNDATVKDRIQQQEMNFHMISIEKWVTFLLMVFILLIASFNIISTLCMLIIEKQQSMSTLVSLGMTRREVGATFWWESIYVTLLGGISGVVIGVVLCLMQEHFGIIKLGGDPATMVVSAYPVVVEWGDLGLAIAPVLLIGIVTAAISSAFARSRIQ